MNSSRPVSILHYPCKLISQYTCMLVVSNGGRSQLTSTYLHTIDPVDSTDWRFITVINELLLNLITGFNREGLISSNGQRQPVKRRNSWISMDMIEVVILLVRDPLSNLTKPKNVIKLSCSRVDGLSLSRAITDCTQQVGNTVIIYIFR